MINKKKLNVTREYAIVSAHIRTFPHQKKETAPLPVTEAVMAERRPPAFSNEGQAKIRQNEGVVLRRTT